MDDQSAPDRQIPDAVVLAAVARAALHRARPGDGAPPWEIAAHLGIRRSSARGAMLRATLTALEERGLLLRTREHGVSLSGLTPAGRRRLAAARRGADPPHLPESPQHLAWRRAQTSARIELGRLAADLRESHHDCERLLARLEGAPSRAADSDAWFALAERLRRDCRRVGGAWHCLHEWQEPQDAQADIDDLGGPEDDALGERLPAVRARRAGRRNTRLWREPS